MLQLIRTLVLNRYWIKSGALHVYVFISFVKITYFNTVLTIPILWDFNKYCCHRVVAMIWNL